MKLGLLEDIFLSLGSHESFEGGRACLMEVVSFLAGEPWSDTPECASPVLGVFFRNWNDSLPDDERQTLKRYAPRLVGSRGTEDAARVAAQVAAWEAAWSALNPTKKQLQVSAHDLVDRMLAVKEETNKKRRDK